MTHEASVDQANEAAVRRIVAAEPVLVDLRPAGEVIAALGARDLLHAGPPLAGWPAVGGALKASVLGTLVHLGLAATLDQAEALAASGAIRLHSANDHGAGGTFAGVIGRGTPVFVVENRAAGTCAFAALNEGRGKALRYGANDAETLARLAWIEGEFAEVLGAAIRRSGGIDLYAILEHALHMGDDGHSRQKAASALFMNALAPAVAGAGFGTEATARALEFLAKNEIFFLPLTMAAGKAAMLSADGIAGSSLVTCMALNGVEFAIKVAGLGGRWFTAAVPAVTGKYFDGYGPDDATPAIGDSEIAETCGFGAFAMSAAPALSRYMGGTPEEMTRLALGMYDITVAEHPRFTVPTLNYRGTPVGIDIRRVVETGVAPIFNTGIAHKTPGVGQIGAGYARTPLACYRDALAALERQGG